VWRAVCPQPGPRGLRHPCASTCPIGATGLERARLRVTNRRFAAPSHERRQGHRHDQGSAIETPAGPIDSAPKSVNPLTLIATK